MRIPGGTIVGLCAHVPIHPADAKKEGMVLEVTTDDGKFTVLLCSACWVQYTADDDLKALVVRQLTTGKNGWDVKLEAEVSS
jgi:hypothetical protein